MTSNQAYRLYKTYQTQTIKYREYAESINLTHHQLNSQFAVRFAAELAAAAKLKNH
jgi:hypothetical protein